MRKTLLMLLALLTVFAHAQETYKLELTKSTLQISGTSTVSDWVVNAESISGDLSTNRQEITSLELLVPVANIKSERGPTMDNKMHAALKKEAHPTVKFVLENHDDASVILGNLTIAGVTNPVEIPVDFKVENEWLNITGKKPIMLKDFEMEPPSAMFGQIVVGEEVFVIFDLYYSKD
ncbi:YceI family protein [Maribacter aestuarii]|uniref:YceI family protein n=1 Tax=Maribacter aestuarii TaxID=1130723 RepID=UPI00248CFF9A|nr:YceI family protein [Maribacter aestuarii]